MPELYVSKIGALEDGQRYGSKASVTIDWGGRECDATVIFMNSVSSTGEIPEGSIIKEPRPIYHPTLSLEWAIPLYSKHIDTEEIDFQKGDIKHISIEHTPGKPIKLRETRVDAPFATLARVVETEAILMANEEHPKGNKFKVFDPHMLNNDYRNYEKAVLIRSVKKGTPLNDVDEQFINNTGGVKAYLI